MKKKGVPQVGTPDDEIPLPVVYYLDNHFFATCIWWPLVAYAFVWVNTGSWICHLTMMSMRVMNMVLWW